MSISITYKDVNLNETINFMIDDTKTLDLIHQSTDKHAFLKSSIELGCYVQSLCQPTRNGFQITEQINKELISTISNIQEVFEPLKTNGTSQKIGRLGELLAEKHIRKSLPEYTYEDTALTEKSGDAIMETDIGKIIIEYKHYGSSVASHQIEKLKRDMCAQNINYSVMMSYKSPICGKKEFDIDMFDGNKLIVYIHTAGYDGHCLILAIRLLSHLVKLDVLKRKEQISDIVKETQLNEYMKFYDKLIVLSRKLTQTQNSIIEAKQSINMVMDNLLKQSIENVSEINLLLSRVKEYSDECKSQQLVKCNTYQELIDHVDKSVEKKSDIVLCKRLLSLCESYNIQGSIDENSIVLVKQTISVGKLIFLKSRCDVVFNNNQSGPITLNPDYEIYKHNKFYISLKLKDEIWKIIDNRLKI